MMYNKTFLSLLTSASLLWMSCGSNKDNGNLANKPVLVETQRLGSNLAADDLVKYNSTVNADKSIYLSFQASGTLLSFPIEVGQYVQKGQLIGQIDATVYKEQYAAQAAQAKLAKENYQRISTVFQKGSVAEIKMLSAKSDFEAATASANAVYQNINHTKLYAPQSGYIGEKKVEAGANVGPGTIVAVLFDIQTVSVHVPVPEKEINKFKKGDLANIQVNAVEGKTFQGKINKISIVPSESSPVYTVEISINNTGMQLKPGMSCTVTFPNIVGNNLNQPEIVLPNEAVQIDEQGNNYVFVVQNKKAVRKNVTIGSLNDNGITIISGLSDNDVIITSGFHKITDGSEIEVKNK